MLKMLATIINTTTESGKALFGLKEIEVRYHCTVDKRTQKTMCNSILIGLLS